jgi:hypothetical protein
MTVFQGARIAGNARPFLPPAHARSTGPRRRRLSAPARARRRTHPVGRLLAAVLVALLIGLIYLAQTVNLAATNYELDEVLGERDALARQVHTLETAMLRWGAEPMILDRAQQAGLESLGARIRIAAR